MMRRTFLIFNAIIMIAVMTSDAREPTDADKKNIICPPGTMQCGHYGLCCNISYEVCYKNSRNCENIFSEGENKDKTCCSELKSWTETRTFNRKKEGLVNVCFYRLGTLTWQKYCEAIDTSMAETKDLCFDNSSLTVQWHNNSKPKTSDSQCDWTCSFADKDKEEPAESVSAAIDYSWIGWIFGGIFVFMSVSANIYFLCQRFQKHPCTVFLGQRFIKLPCTCAKPTNASEIENTPEIDDQELTKFPKKSARPTRIEDQPGDQEDAIYMHDQELTDLCSTKQVQPTQIEDQEHVSHNNDCATAVIVELEIHQANNEQNTSPGTGAALSPSPTENRVTENEPALDDTASADQEETRENSGEPTENDLFLD